MGNGGGGSAGKNVYGPVNKGNGCYVPRLPDFINFQIDAYVLSAWGTFTRDGHSFVGGGLNKSYVNPVSLNANASAGWINTWHVAPGQTDNFISGYSGAGAVAYDGLGGGLVYSPAGGTTTTATVLGIGAGASLTPSNTRGGGSVGGGRSFDMGQTGLSWTPNACTCP